MSSKSDTFDAQFWKQVNEALDQALELGDSDRDAFLDALASENMQLATSVKRLLPRINGDARTVLVSAKPTTKTQPTEPLKTGLVRPGLTTEIASIYDAKSPIAERGFDGLLQRALRAERSTHKSARHRGELCGPWRLMNVLGTGGMGEVWLAERADGLFSAKAAVKFLRPDSNMQAFEARFAQERVLLARLNHAGIARLLDAGRQFGDPFLVLEYVEGMPLLNYLIEYAPTVEQRLRVFRSIVEAVSYAHTQLVVHRDLKPSNILVSPSGQVKLLDFGVAGLLNSDDSEETTESPATKIGGRGLTLEYAAPEQITGDNTGIASDIYSLGALGYHIVCGQRAHIPDKPGRAALEHAVLHTEAKRLSDAVRTAQQTSARDSYQPPSDTARVNADLDAIFARAMRRNPQDRYRTADEFLADLRRFSDHRPISTRREDRAYRMRLWLRRNWLPAALTASLVIALATGLGVSLWQAKRAQEEASRANQTAAYLSELLSGADPDLHGGNWPTVLNLIERAQTDLSTKFQGEANVEQKLSHSIATILRRLSRFQDAYPIAQRSYELSRALYGESAESTRIAGALLADVMYWIDKTEEAIPIVEHALGKETPDPIPEWWRAAFLLRANMVAELRRFDEAYAGFDRYRVLVRGQPYESWLEAEAETDRAIALMSQGRHKESLALHRKYRDALANAPDLVAKRISLTNLNNGDMMRLYMGEAVGLEEAFKTNLTEWDRLAGPHNQHSIEAVGRLGLYYYYYDRPDDAVAMYRERLRRLAAQKITAESMGLFIRIDLLETDSKYFLRSGKEIIANAIELETSVLLTKDIEPATRDRYLQRLAFVRATFGDVSALAASVHKLPPPLELGNQRPDRAATRWIATATVLAATGRVGEACDALNFAADRLGEKNRVLIATPLYLRRALVCILARSPDTATHLSTARGSMPESLPTTHRLRKVYAHIERIAAAKDNEEITQSQNQLANELHAPELSKLNPALLGLVF